MKELYREKSGMIFKFWINQFAFSILGIMTTLAINALNANLSLLGGIFSACFFFSVTAYAVYEDGAKDALKVAGNRMPYRPLYGLYYTAVAYLPTVVVVLGYMLLKLCGMGANMFLSIVNVLIRFFIMGMYLGIDTSIRSTSQAMMNLSDNGVFFALFLIFAPAVCALAYYCGLKNFHLFQKAEKK